MAVTHVLDGGAASRYSEGDPRVVTVIRTARQRGHRVVVPASCLRVLRDTLIEPL